VIGAIANFVVRMVRAGHRQQVWLSVAGLVLTLVVATAYLLIGALRVTPFTSSYRVTVQLPESGGLLPNQDVALRGVRIGRVESLQITDTGVNAIANITSKARIPANSVARVSALSPAGEQYINFEAESDAGPYLHDGSFISLAHASGIPVVGVYETMPAGYDYQSWMTAEISALGKAVTSKVSTEHL